MTEDVAQAYQELSLEKLCEISWNLFSLFTKDPLVANFRRLLMREQFGNEQAARQYGESYLLGVVHKQSKTFAKLVEGGLFREENPVLIVHAEDDKLADYSKAALWSEKIPNCTFVSCKTGGHLMTGNSGEIDEAFNRFIHED